jgi:hypothetical protein
MPSASNLGDKEAALTAIRSMSIAGVACQRNGQKTSGEDMSYRN